MVNALFPSRETLDPKTTCLFHHIQVYPHDSWLKTAETHTHMYIYIYTYIYIHIPTISPLRGIVGVINGNNNGEYIVNPLTMVKNIRLYNSNMSWNPTETYIYIYTNMEVPTMGVPQ